MITNEEFTQLQENLGLGYDGLAICSNSIQSGTLIVVDTNDVDAEVDMLVKCNANIPLANPAKTASIMAPSFEALQQHLFTRTGLTIPQFLESRSLKVGQSFANLAEALGVTIGESLITP